MYKRNNKLVPNEEMQSQLEDIVGRRKVLYIICEPNRVDLLKIKGQMKELGKKRKKPVVCITNGVTYPSISEASLALGLGVGAISKCASGKQHSTQGHTFSFKDNK